MATANYDGMSAEALEALAAKLAQESAQLSAERKLVALALTGKRGAAKAQAKIAAMTPAERAALAQVLQADGIPGGEEFGQLGG